MKVTPIWEREPVAILAIVQAIVALVVAFGLDLSGDQVGAISAVAAVLLGVTARSRTTPAETPIG